MNGTEMTWKVKALARTYIQSAQGTIKSMKFTTEDAEDGTEAGTFTADIQVDMSISAATVVFASNLTYPNGYTLVIGGSSPDMKRPQATNTTDGNSILITVTQQGFDGQIMNI